MGVGLGVKQKEFTSALEGVGRSDLWGLRPNLLEWGGGVCFGLFPLGKPNWALVIWVPHLPCTQALLIEVGFGDPQEGTVSLGTQCEDEGFPGEHRQLSHQLPWLGHKQAHFLSLVNHSLVHVQASPEHKVQAHILGRQGLGNEMSQPQNLSPKLKLVHLTRKLEKGLRGNGYGYHLW